MTLVANMTLVDWVGLISGLIAIGSFIFKHWWAFRLALPAALCSAALVFLHQEDGVVVVVLCVVVPLFGLLVNLEEEWRARKRQG